MNEILKMEVSILNLRKNITNNLKANKIETILELCKYSRIELSNLNFNNNQINEIIIALQLVGLDLKKNHAKKNTLLESYI